MKHLLTRIGLALATTATAIGAQTAPAFAGGFTLDLAPQSSAVVGRPMIIRATGTIPPRSVHLPHWFSLSAIPTSVTTTCPEDRWEGMQFANAGGGTIVVLTQNEHPNASGNFTIPVVVKPSAPGTVLLCGYTDDGEAITLARAQLVLRIGHARSGRAGGGSGAASVVAYATRRIRICKARGGPKANSCVRAALRTSTARCRRLHPRSARTRCLRGVRRVAGRRP